MKYLHYWIGSKKKKNSKGASLWKQPLDNLPCKMLKFIHIASSSGINKAITCENNCLSNCVLFQILAFNSSGSMTPAAFKMELLVTKIKGWKLQRVPSYKWQGS